jgi:hypothetical protein
MLKQFLIDVRVRLAALFARRNLNERADEELQFHLASLEQRMVESGVARDVARARARRAAGSARCVRSSQFRCES